MKSKFWFILFLLLITFQLNAQNLGALIQKGKIDEVKKILNNNKTLLEEKNAFGWTPLHTAANFGQLEIAKYLLENNVDIESNDKHKLTPLHRAAQRGHASVVRLLCDSGANTNAVHNFDETPLSIAVFGNHLEVVKILLKNKVDPNFVMKNGETVLHHAAGMGFAEMIKLLIENGAEVNVKKELDITPLHIAAAYGNLEAVKMLVAKGINIDVVSNYVGSALDLANAGNREKVVKFLIKAGATESNWKSPELNGIYFGMKEPGLTPEIFAPGILKTFSRWVSPPSFTLDGNYVYWSSFEPHSRREDIWYMKSENGIWKSPKLLEISTKYRDCQPLISANGKELFFHSNRPVKPGAKPRSSHLWRSSLNGAKFSKPVNLKMLNKTFENFPSIASDKTIYLQSFDRENGIGATDIFISEPIENNYQTRIVLNENINSKYAESFPCIAPDDSYLLFASQRPGGYSQQFDIYVSFRDKDGNFTKAKNLGEKINKLNPMFPKISPDGKYLFFISNQDIYWVSTNIINELNN